MFKRSRHNISSIFIINQDYYDIPKRSIRANGNINHIFKQTNYRDIQNLHQDKVSMEMTLDEFKILKSKGWGEKYQPLNIDKMKVEFTGRYHLGLNTLFCSKDKCFSDGLNGYLS